MSVELEMIKSIAFAEALFKGFAGFARTNNTP